MKNILNLTTLAILMLLITSFKSEVEITERISSIIRSGDAHELALHFDRRLELVIDTEKVNFNNIETDHAELILKNFFKKHPPKSFTYIYQGSADRMRYSTATYNSSTKVFEVYILMRKSKNDYVINTLHFRKE